MLKSRENAQKPQEIRSSLRHLRLFAAFLGPSQSMCRQTAVVWAALVVLLSGVSTELPAQPLGNSNVNTTVEMVLIPAGIFRPLFRGQTDLKEVPVKSFYLDACAVTRAEYLQFVRANPRWRRSE